MKTKSVEIRQELNGLVGSQTALMEAAQKENRALNEAETKSFNDLQTQIEERKLALGVAETMEENQRNFGGGNGGVSIMDRTAEESGKGGEGQKRQGLSIHSIIRSQMANGSLEGEELRVHTESKRSAESQNLVVTGVVVPFGNRATKQTVTEDGGDYGGNLVPTDLQPTIEFLRPEPLIEKMGVVVTTGLKGNLKYPVNEGGIIATWEGETEETTGTANKYGYIDSVPKRLSVTVPISLQNIMQSSPDLEKETERDILLAIGNAIDVAFVNGSGSGQPLGVLNNNGVNTVPTGTNGSAPTWDNLVDMETSIFVENASSARMNYLLNPKTRGKLKKTKHEAGDLNYLMDKSGEVNGYTSYTSNHVPSNLVKGTGTGLSAGVFGDFTQGRVNIWGFMDISVDDKSRKKEGLIEVTANVFVDVVIRQPKSFSVIKGWITV